MATSIDHVLEAVGVSRPEETLYLALLEAPASTPAALVRRGGFASKQEVQQLLDALEGRGLASRLPGTPVRWQPAPPQTAIEVLVLQRQEALERTRLAAASLQRRLRGPAQPEVGDVVEAVIGRDAIAQRLAQLEMAAQQEILAFDKPPYITPAPDVEPREQTLLERGIRVRAVYDPESIAEAGAEQLTRLAERGEQARMAAVPAKLVIADRRAAILPYRLADTPVDVALLLHPSPLLDVVVQAFERTWALAVPLGHGQPLPDGEGNGNELSPLDDETRRLLMLLATGHNDKLIAQELDVAVRTLRRRITRLLLMIGARSRFQLGVVAAHHGWLS